MFAAMVEGAVSILGKLKVKSETRESSSAKREIPSTLRGIRVVTRITDLFVRALEKGAPPTTLTLTLADEIVLFDHAGEVLGTDGAAAVAAGADAWRAFLRSWAQKTLKVELVFEASETTLV
ncbi:MAG: hypothetical protein J0L92_24620 [Deltaproteobacteria bacterium]|nr:hypothetical protein [Deltaproteobacteria bacterium]